MQDTFDFGPPFAFGPGEFHAYVSEQLGRKSGITCSVDDLRRLSAAYARPAQLMRSQAEIAIQVSRTDLFEAVAALLFELGTAITPYWQEPGYVLKRQHGNDPRLLAVAMDVVERWQRHIGPALAAAQAGTGPKAWDPTSFVEDCNKVHGVPGRRLALEYTHYLDDHLLKFPWGPWQYRRIEWNDTLDLQELFDSESLSTSHGTYVDQRFIDYQHRQSHELGMMNWRKFEGLAAEFFEREGYQVRVGAGRADGGVDIRLWRPSADLNEPPLVLVQCKRQKEKVSQVVVKALWADVVHEGAESGMVVTTSALAPSAEVVRVARGYRIHAIERAGLRRWLEKMRSPWTGVHCGR